MDLPSEQVVHSMQDLAEAWVAANTETSFRRTQVSTQPDGSTPSASFSDVSPQANIDRDLVVISPSLEDRASPQRHGQCPAPTTVSPAMPASRKRKQASPQPCRESLDASSGPSPAKTPAKTTAKEKVPADSKHGKMLPVHCSIETVDLPPGKKKNSVVEGYAIVPSILLLTELVRVAMTKLDFPKEQIRNATGVIQVQNWKALPFSQITDDPQANVGQILGDLLSYITLKIKITSSRTPNARTSSSSLNPGSQMALQLGPQPSLFGFPLKKSVAGGSELPGSRGALEIRLKLLQLLEKRGPTLLVSHGCPFSQGTVLAILQGIYTKTIQQEKLQSFYQWYNIYNGLMDNTLVAADKLDSVLPVKPSSRHWRRPRTLFDQRYELPRLMGWYRANPRPSRAELEIFLAELNSSERRRNSHPLQYSSIAIWFKNARAKYRGLRGLSPDSPEPHPDRSTSRLAKGQIGRMADVTDRRRENCNGPRPGYIQLGHGKVKVETRSKFGGQSRAVSKTTDLSRAEPRTPHVGRTSLSNGHASTNSHVTTLLSTPDISSRTVARAVSSSSCSEQAVSPTLSGNASATSQVTDIRKIASGFGIMLSPAVQENVTPSERKLLSNESIKMEDLTPSSSAAPTPPHDASTALNLTSTKPTSSCTSSASDTSTTLTNPTAATSLVVPSISMGTVSVAPIRIPTSAMVHSSMTNGPVPPKLSASSEGSTRGLSLTPPSSGGGSGSTTPKGLASRPTRKRFNIHPSLEVPKLQAWFCVNPKPDRHTIDQFVAELNRTEFRKNQPKYDSRIVYVWFKNARAKYSRQKIREGEEVADTSNLTLTYSRVIQL